MIEENETITKNGAKPRANVVRTVELRSICRELSYRLPQLISVHTKAFPRGKCLSSIDIV